MPKSRPQPPRPDRRRSIRGSFSWIDHRFLREGFDEGLTRLEKLLYFVLVAVSNQDGVSFYSDARLSELMDIRFPHELDGARKELVARDLITYERGIYQVLDLPPALPGNRVNVLHRHPVSFCVRVPPFHHFAKTHCATRLRIWRVSSRCWKSAAGGVHETLCYLSAHPARQHLSLSCMQ